MLFKYLGVDQKGEKQEGTIDVVNRDVAISSLQKRGLTLYSVESAEQIGILSKEIGFLTRVSSEDLVVFSRQVATLFQARVSTLEVFRVLASETENAKLGTVLNDVADSIQGGSSMAQAFGRHPDVFSLLFVNMVRAGEESGKLGEVFEQLADHLERSHDLITRTRNALIYPAFVVVAFVVVMFLMFTMVIPRISSVLTESGQELPIYTKIVLSASTFLNQWWLAIVIVTILVIAGGVWYSQTDEGREAYERFILSTPYLGKLYQRVYLARLADTMKTMLGSGIPLVRALEISEGVISNHVYQGIIQEAREDVRGGSSLSGAFGRHKEVSGIFTQMTRVGEESGQLVSMLETVANFYSREVASAIDTIIGLIEPILILFLGIGVAVLLASILMPIYNLVGAF